MLICNGIKGDIAFIRFCHARLFIQNVCVENFHESFADGLALAAIMHSYFPDDIPYSELTSNTRRKNFEISFQIAK